MSRAGSMATLVPHIFGAGGERRNATDSGRCSRAYGPVRLHYVTPLSMSHPAWFTHRIHNEQDRSGTHGRSRLSHACRYVDVILGIICAGDNSSITARYVIYFSVNMILTLLRVRYEHRCRHLHCRITTSVRTHVMSHGDSSTNCATTTHGTANKALQVTPIRLAKLCLHRHDSCSVMSHRVGIGGAPELGRCAASTSLDLKFAFVRNFRSASCVNSTCVLHSNYAQKFY
jgi:hypothetical protein